ncbi:hypothetical protein [Vulcaniibacterium tengchongense]|uniref:Uncharacterized protein n=1 Tax=Vulcaniibacterium tengchongense TaxID=1273429 RepID=A0A3N4VRT8_9GAMM|nr:hypothetical protein [Vulcaniibacterium tengchongense]RPE81921.1 hypothetical protein EDC50_1124 [Vulcaniibacterium tengchongense]
MKHHIAMFKFTLGNDQSIGPAALQALWARACRSSNVSVGRQRPDFGGHGKATYSLYAPQQLPDLPEVEIRLRRLLEESKLSASLVALHR